MPVQKSSQLITNIVGKERMREFQQGTLTSLKDALKCSYGPMGSNTVITKENMPTKYSKDGHTILQNIIFQDIIENSVKSDIEDITRHLVKKIGDGTTAGVILSAIMFDKLKELENDYTPYGLIEEFKNAVEDIKLEIFKNKKVFDSDTAYKIAYISTNGNDEVAKNIKDIYDEFGDGVFIEVSISNTTDNILKTYEGMTLEVGYSDSAYINTNKGTCELRNPEIYAFEDPIDTREMSSFLGTIIEHNIMRAYKDQTGNTTPVPTVILAPKISKDMCSYIDQLVDYMYRFKDLSTKPPLLIISNIYHQDVLLDITRLCGCKTIKKYIDPKIQEQDAKIGLAPTLETIFEFAGTADMVQSDLSVTKFVNPKKMYDENGEYSIDFQNTIKFLENEIENANMNKEDVNTIGNLKRRLNSLKSNMVEYLVGGISISDRDSLKDLVEDAVLNCRSAAFNGVGYGANFEGLFASYKLKDKSNMHRIIFEAYEELARTLYSTAMNEDKAKTIADESLEHEMPYNLRNKEFDGTVLCTIMSDPTILDAISQIISLMFTSNQFICPSIAHNRYLFL